MSAYLSRDVEACRKAGHRFHIAGSDKTPLKRNLICATCTDSHTGQTAYVAYGDETKSWGQWRTVRGENQQLEEQG